MIQNAFHVTVFERHGQLGGAWCYAKNDHLSQTSPFPGVNAFLPLEVSPVYKCMRTNVPIQSMGIDGFPIPSQEEIRFGHRSEIHEYLDTYAKHLEQEWSEMIEFRLNSNVESVRFDGGWSVVSRGSSGNTVREDFDVVVVATGPFHQPSFTNLHDPEYAGLYFHSLYYDDPAVFNNRTVLIVGCHNSGRDLFWDAVERAEHVVLACPTERDRNNLVFPEDLHSELRLRFTSVGRRPPPLAVSDSQRFEEHLLGVV